MAKITNALIVVISMFIAVANCLEAYLLPKKFGFAKGSVYFTANILAATDRLELLRRQSNIRSPGMTQCK